MSWLRRVFPGLLTLLALMLGVLGVVIGIYVDSRYLGYLNDHPVTANVIAGLLGLPAAFLVVNPAAERAIRWSSEFRWDQARINAAQRLADAWFDFAAHSQGRSHPLGHSPASVRVDTVE